MGVSVDSLTFWLWEAMIGYGVVMYLLSPRATTVGQFHAARDRSGREVGLGLLVGAGRYGSLLGVNLALTVLVVLGFFVGALMDQLQLR